LLAIKIYFRKSIENQKKDLIIIRKYYPSVMEEDFIGFKRDNFWNCIRHRLLLSINKIIFTVSNSKKATVVLIELGMQIKLRLN
jgi:hypothetical protein